MLRHKVRKRLLIPVIDMFRMIAKPDKIAATDQVHQLEPGFIGHGQHKMLVAQGYQAFFDTIRETLPEVIIAGDSTQPTYYAWLNYETEQPRRYFHSASGFGTLGYAIPAAIGAKLGRPDLPVIGLIGDGASQFTIGELASAVEAAVPVIFLLWNNNGYSEIRRFMADGDITPIGVDIHGPDFVSLGQAFGCEATRVESLVELRSELLLAEQRSGPTVIEVVEGQFVDGFPMG